MSRRHRYRYRPREAAEPVGSGTPVIPRVPVSKDGGETLFGWVDADQLRRSSPAKLTVMYDRLDGSMPEAKNRGIDQNRITLPNLEREMQNIPDATE